MYDVITSPTFILQVTGLAITLLTALASVGVARWNKRQGIQIEQSYVDSIFAGIESITAAALADGRTDMAEIVQLTLAYLELTKPDAMAAMQPDEQAIENMATKAILKNFPEKDIVGGVVGPAI